MGKHNKENVITEEKDMSEINDSLEKTEEKHPNPSEENKHDKKQFSEFIHDNIMLVTFSLIAIISYAIRWINITLSDTGTYPVFDEKHYVSQAHQMVHNSGLEDNPAYGLVVHPPLGKWLIAIGEIIFGYNPIGWRFMSILAGTITVIAISFIAYRLTRSIGVAILTAILSNLEGVTYSMSRLGMLDSFLGMMSVLIFLCVVMEITTDNKNVPWHRHWWLLLAGILSGLAMSIKISGVYYPALCGIVLVFGVMFTQAIYLHKKENGKYTLKSSQQGWLETLRALGMGLIFFLILPITIVFMTYLPWLSQENSVYRRGIDSGKVNDIFPQSMQWVPDPIQDFFAYQYGVLKFHTGLTTSSGNLHPWESKPWEWLYGNRPMLILDSTDGDGITKWWIMTNIAIWWLVIPMLVFAVVRIIMKDKKWWIVIAAFVTGWLPWMIAYDRQMYLFYTTVIAPFVALGIAFMIYDIAKFIHHKKNTESISKPFTILSSIYLVPVVVCAIVYSPWVLGIPLSQETHDSLRILDSWNALEKESE